MLKNNSREFSSLLPLHPLLMLHPPPPSDALLIERQLASQPPL